MTPLSSLPKVFISYSHDSREHADRVFAFAERLREWGVDCHLDQYETSPPEGWPRWMERQIREAAFVLVVCTETYHRRFTGEEEAGKGAGAKWEGAIITNGLYEAEGRNAKFIPVVFSAADIAHIPERLRVTTRYQADTDEGFESLYRHLTNQPLKVKRPLGRLRELPPVNRRQEFEPIEAPKPPRAEVDTPLRAEVSSVEQALPLISVPSALPSEVSHVGEDAGNNDQ
jgi:hypothetical protein